MRLQRLWEQYNGIIDDWLSWMENPGDGSYTLHAHKNRVSSAEHRRIIKGDEKEHPSTNRNGSR